jgi:hypothetical protein
MPYCIKVSEFNPDIHAKISGPHTLSECQQICGMNALNANSVKSSGCGCSQRAPEMFEVVENINA